MTSREAALLLYTSLSGEAEAELEHTPLHRINAEDGIDYILQALKAPMEQKSVYQKRKFFAHFDQLNRYPSEGLRTYANRYRRVELSLEALGVNITGMYDVDARGNPFTQPPCTGNSRLANYRPYTENTEPYLDSPHDAPAITPQNAHYEEIKFERPEAVGSKSGL